jgi:hypothetical protein
MRFRIALMKGGPPANRPNLEIREVQAKDY